jgi:phage shock protein PspC (stress-responsive transcriptional regulator)
MTHLETEPVALPPPTPEGPVPDRRWARSEDRIVLGVAGGLGRALAIDPLVIRIAFVVLALFSGAGIAFYLAGLLLLADSPSSPPPSVLRRVLGVAAALLSARWLFGGGASLPDAGWVIAIALLGAAVALWRGRVPGGQRTTPTSTEVAVADGSSGERWKELGTRRGGDRPRPPRSALGLLTIGAATVVGASVWLLAGDSHHRGALAFGWATVVIGCGLLVGAFVGRARWLVAPAALTAVAAVLASALSFAGVDLNHHSGGNTVFVSSGGTVAPTYRTGIGDFELVLTNYPSDVTTTVEVGVGTLTVVVPDDARVQLDARVGIGMIDALGSTRSGYRRILKADDNTAGAPLIKLTLRVGVGEIDVRRGSFVDIPRPFLPAVAPQLLPGGPALRSFVDGTVLFADGSIDFGDGGRMEPDGSFNITIVEQRPDGSVQLENGAVVRADGTVVTPGGFVINRTGVIESAPTSTGVQP